jgi:dimethylamine/trimethylamine dehydrogenase
MIEVTREATRGKAAVAVRMAVDELHGSHGISADGEAREIMGLLAELPDLWDVNVAGALGNDSKSARFSEEGYQDEYISFVKSMTSKPVVTVGRFTSPDLMVSRIRRGLTDFIGAARPSIADPFLPTKIREGREDEIRECIGCNICRAANNEGVPLRCTQNPTMGEEWRRGWHPERIESKHGDAHVLVVGGGPAGLECALALGKRGYEVTLAEATSQLGGRVLLESSLPGLGTWIRVRDHRETMLAKLANVSIYRESRLTAEDVIGFGADHVVLATGSSWRKDGIGAMGETPADIADDAPIATPDALGDLEGPIVIYDDDHYAVASALAEKLKKAGHEVTYVTPAPVVSSWTAMTDEQGFIQARLMALGVELLLSHGLVSATRSEARFACAYSGQERTLPLGRLILVTGKLPDDALYHALAARCDAPAMTRIGDCFNPSHIADAVFSGHRFAREFGNAASQTPLRRERPES